MNKYLNEERYQSMKKKIILIATIVLIAGLALSATLLALGIKKKSSISETKINSQIYDIQEEIDELEVLQSEEFRNNGFSSEYYSLQREIDSLKDEIFSLREKSSSGFYVFLFIGSGAVLLFTLGTSGYLYYYAYRRSIMAFGVQQTMPIAQEGMDAIAPSLGKVTEEITKGISRGKNKDKE